MTLIEVGFWVVKPGAELEALLACVGHRGVSVNAASIDKVDDHVGLGGNDVDEASITKCLAECDPNWEQYLTRA